MPSALAYNIPCNSSNCRNPCDCKNTGSDECDAPNQVVGAILPVLVAAPAVGAPAGDDSESDDDVPSFVCLMLHT